MSKAKRASPTRGLRPAASPSTPKAEATPRTIDPARVAAQNVAALGDAVVVKGISPQNPRVKPAAARGSARRALLYS